ncbi:hypothetical protein BDR22DRAFT_818715 [Usnea florida]
MTVMPLSELHGNHPARNGLGHPQDDLHDGRSRTGTPNGDENSDILKNPSSIQSMLRNTTETGNVGQFSIKPSRVPPSLSRPSKPRMTPNKQRQPGAYYNRLEDSSTEHTSLHSRHEPAAFNGSAFQNQGSRPFRGSPRSPSVEDHRSYSTTKSSHAGHSLNSHHSPPNGGHGGPGGPHNLRPRSPFAYPTRLKRPGYRPSSPALSELHKQNRSQTSLHRRPSFRTNSPSSLHTNGARSPWRKGVNRSDPLLRYYPQTAVPISGRVPSTSPALIRPHTIKASPSLKSIANSAISLQATTNGSWINPQSPTSSPIFYDYSEAFEEQGAEQQDYSHHASLSTGTLVEHQMHDTATTTFYELDASSDSTGRAELTSEKGFAKLGTQVTDNRFDQSTSEFEIDDGSSMQALHKDLSEVPELPEGDFPNADGSVAPGKHDDCAIDRDSQCSHPKEAPSLMANGEDSKHIPGSEKSQEPLLQPQNMAKISRVSGSPYRSTSSPIDSIHSAQSTLPAHEVKDSPPEIPEAIPRIVASPPPAGNPAADSNHGNFPEAESRPSMQSVRAISLEDHSGNEHTVTEILSPTPDRSMTSPTSLGRFSKILSINDDLLDLDDLAKRIKGKDGANSPMQAIVDSKARVARVEPPWRKRSVQLRDTATRQNAANYALVEVSDSEDEPELTQGLRQTFCKPDERPSQNRPRSPPIILPSQLVHRGYPGPLSIRRSPAVRRSKSDFRKVPDLPDTHPNQDLESPEAKHNSAFPPLEAKQLSAAQLEADRYSESSKKYSIHRGSNLDIEPPRIANEESPLLATETPDIGSLPAPVEPLLSSIPFSFTPLIQRKSRDETDSMQEIEDVASSPLDQGNKTNENEEIAVQKPATSFGPDTSSVSSSPASRPWNLDTSYPWSNQQPKLEVTMPERRGETEDPDQSTRNLPRFRFKIQRASSNTEGTENVTKYPFFSDLSSSPFAPSHDAVQGTAFRRTRYPTLSVLPGQINSSHDALRSSASRTRFVESFETQSPRITLMPQSPGFEARSFFSDDSSQIRSRGAFRKRFSALRNRTSRGASAEEPRGYDRGLLGSALGRSRASGRSSRQSENTAITAGASSHTKRARRKLLNKLRSWWQRGEDRVREWRWRRRYNGAVGRSMSADLYAGV